MCYINRYSVSTNQFKFDYKLRYRSLTSHFIRYLEIGKPLGNRPGTWGIDYTRKSGEYKYIYSYIIKRVHLPDQITIFICIFPIYLSNHMLLEAEVQTNQIKEHLEDFPYER